MDEENTLMDSEMSYPILFIPKKCTTLETNCEISDDVFIDVNITSPDTEGNETCIYNGFCNIKLINYDGNLPEENSSLEGNETETLIVTDLGNQVPCTPYSQSQVWIDPVRSPYVYNSFDGTEQEHYSVYHKTHMSHITVEQHNTYITQNVYNYKESIHYSPADEFEHKKFRKIQMNENQNSTEPNQLYEEDEFECGVFLSQLPEEIMNEKETKAREELKYIGLQSENDALKQLMSSDIQSMSKQRKTILFLGHDSHRGQTIQKIAVNDLSLECAAGSSTGNNVVIADNYPELKSHRQSHERDSDTDYTLSLDGSDSDILTLREVKCESELSKQEEIKRADSIIAKVMSNKIFLAHSKKSSRHKKYKKACDVCLKTFDRVGDLKRHLIEHVIRSTLAKTPVSDSGTLNIQCEICQAETFTKVDKYKAHLREHAKLTLYKCTFCDKSFSDSSNFSKHKKIHGTTYFQCDLCQRKFNSKKMITQHMEYHNNNSPIPCFYCDKEFHFESMLNKHVKCAHTKETSTRFRCRFCREYFKALKEKWDHEWTVHNVRKMIVDCLICDSKFRKYSELKRHCNDVHDMEIPPAKKLLKRRRYV